jgi:hypothetical protein
MLHQRRAKDWLSGAFGALCARGPHALAKAFEWPWQKRSSCYSLPTHLFFQWLAPGTHAAPASPASPCTHVTDPSAHH